MLPLAPGTWGSLAVTAIYAALAARTGPVTTHVALAAVAVAGSLGCLLLGGFAERTFGKKDPGKVSLDEWVGQAITYLGLPVGAGWAGVAVPAAAGLVAFRVFDITKPPPARGLQKVKGGLGILIDDVIAAVYANVACQLVLRLL
jgi:phosphatidylglycerophosphatase A